MNLTEKTKMQEYIFKGRIINLRRDVAILPDGSEAGREVVEHNGGVCVLPLTENNEIIFVQQFRYPYMTELLEIPAYFCCNFLLSAESEGFEPPDPLRSTVFKTAAFDHSAISPICFPRKGLQRYE